MKRSGYIQRKTRLAPGGKGLARTRVKAVSAKRRARMAEVKPFRQALLAEFPFCMKCGAPSELVHEITNGPLRDKTLDNRPCLLVVCSWCNNHRLDKRTTPVAMQLAIKAIRDGGYYSREEVNRQRKGMAGAIAEIEVIKAAYELGRMNG